jgi:hypothetical protein
MNSNASASASDSESASASSVDYYSPGSRRPREFWEEWKGTTPLSTDMEQWCYRATMNIHLENIEDYPEDAVYVFQETVTPDLAPGEHLTILIPEFQSTCHPLDPEFTQFNGVKVYFNRPQPGERTIKTFHVKKGSEGEMLLGFGKLTSQEGVFLHGHRILDHIVTRECFEWQAGPDFSEEVDDWREISTRTLINILHESTLFKVDLARPFYTFSMECRKPKRRAVVDLTKD